MNWPTDLNRPLSPDEEYILSRLEPECYWGLGEVLQSVESFLQAARFKRGLKERWNKDAGGGAERAEAGEVN